jgi:U3 small nucleolar RNA-associated protein 20
MRAPLRPKRRRRLAGILKAKRKERESASKMDADAGWQTAPIGGAAAADGGAAAAAAAASGSDSGAADGGSDAEEGADARAGDAAEAAAGALSLAGLARRAARLANDRAHARALPRGVALRLVAALASRLGAERLGPHLPALLAPLFRITDPGANAGVDSDEVKALAEEVLAHLRAVLGADALLCGYNAAREAVRRSRTERRAAAATRALVDPEAAARRKLRTAQRKAVGRKRRLEDVRRLRAAGVATKNRRERRPRGGEE